MTETRYRAGRWRLPLALLFACLACAPRILAVPIHPDVDSTVTFTADRGGTRGQIDRMRISVGGVQVADAPGENASYTGGPYLAFSNARLPFAATAVQPSGSSNASGSVYVANPKNVCTRPAATGGLRGYPAGTDEQTGPNLYRLDQAIVLTHAQNAVVEYAQDQGLTVAQVSATADNLVAAVAFYVDRHMSWRDDTQNQAVFAANGFADYAPGWDFPQPADLTLSISGDLTNAAANDDFQGDCEDHAILRAALLRALCFAPWAIWDVIDEPVTHEYNVVLYQGAFRLMDYGLITRWLASHTWASHQSNYGWNQDHGPRGAVAANHTFLVDGTDNYPGGTTCPGDWSFNVYYQDTCP